MSFTCIHVPNFSLQAAIRINPVLRDQAVAILDGTFPLLTIVALSPKAVQKGLHIGMTKTQAELFDVRLLHRSLAQEATAHQALLDCALAISPRVEATSPLKDIGDTVILDTEGLERLYKSPEKIAQKIKRLAHQLNLAVSIGIAPNPEAAATAARGFFDITIIPPGYESKCLGPLPIEMLPISSELQETFKTWGIHTLQALAALPEVGLVKRFGQEGKRLQDLARGTDQRILVPIEPELKFEESMELDVTLERLEPLTFILARLLKQLCTRLFARSLATNEVKLVLELEAPFPVISRDALPSSPAGSSEEFSLAPSKRSRFPSPQRGEGLGVRGAVHAVSIAEERPKRLSRCGKTSARCHSTAISLAPTGGEGGGAKRRVRGRHHPMVQEPTEHATQEQSPLRHSTVLNLPVPTNDSKTLLKLLQLDLESRPPSAPVRSVFLKAEATSPRTTQRELFMPSGPEPEKLEITLARIGAIVGKHRVGSPLLSNTHKPDSFQLKKFLVPAIIKRNSPVEVPQQAVLPRSSFRRFRPPVPVRVETEGTAPVIVFFRNERRTVLECAGPWRINGDWWTDTSWACEEWDVTLPQQSRRPAQTGPFKVISTQETAVYRIYQDLRTRQWFVEGLYD